MHSAEQEFRPWETATFFSVDGVPLVEELKSKWRDLAAEYEQFKHMQVPYGLGVPAGNWLTGAFRSHPLELQVMTIDAKRAAVHAWFPDGGKNVPDEQIS